MRGAYMVSERERAEEEGYESPVFDVRHSLKKRVTAASRRTDYQRTNGQKATAIFPQRLPIRSC